MPRFSILMTSYNYGDFIGAAVESVLNQSYGAWELIIVDDCSIDDSWEIISQYDDPRIKTLRFDTNRGACTAYNVGYQMATGEFIASLDSDDMFAPQKLQRQAAFLEADPRVDVCGTYMTEVDRAAVAVDEKAQLYAPWFNQELDLNDAANWIWQNHLCHSSAVVRKSLHDRLGSFRADFTYTPDWDFWLRALAGGARFHVIQEPLVLYRSHGENITSKDPRAMIWEYADTCGATLHPYLRRIGREDLIEGNVEKFLYRIADIGGLDGLVELVRTVRSAERGFGSHSDSAPSSKEIRRLLDDFLGVNVALTLERGGWSNSGTLPNAQSISVIPNVTSSPSDEDMTSAVRSALREVGSLRAELEAERRRTHSLEKLRAEDAARLSIAAGEAETLTQTIECQRRQLEAWHMSIWGRLARFVDTVRPKTSRR